MAVSLTILLLLPFPMCLLVIVSLIRVAKSSDKKAKQTYNDEFEIHSSDKRTRSKRLNVRDIQIPSNMGIPFGHI